MLLEVLKLVDLYLLILFAYQTLAYCLLWKKYYVLTYIYLYGTQGDSMLCG